MAMPSSSVMGVSSIFNTPIERSIRRIITPPPSISLYDKAHFNFLVLQSSARYKNGLSFVPSAITTPNSILSEEAFKGLIDGLSDFVDDNGEDDGIGDYEPRSGATYGGSLPDEDELSISKLGLPQRLVESLEKRGITHLFPIQRAVLIPALKGQDLIARAKTGTGKTLAFAIPIIKRLTEDTKQDSSQRRTGQLPRALVLAPTRELAKQVEKEIIDSAPFLNTVCVYGGVSYIMQRNALSRGVDIVVGTPGRIIDLIKSNCLKLGEVNYLVLDEADQMLSLGFEEDVELILKKLPSKRQSMLFSATMPSWVKKLSRKYLDNPLQIDLVGDNEEKLAEGIKLYAISTTATSKQSILGDLVTVYAKGGKTIIFTRTKRDADEVSMDLTNSIASEALHGDISQHQRERTLNGFRQGKFKVLVATDVASRGLDIPNVDLVIHYELPNTPEIFVHRSGRTGRAGKEGTAILMFTSSQRTTVRSIEHDVGCKFEFVSPPAIEELPSLQDDGPLSDYYGRFSSRDRSPRGGSRGGQRSFRSSQGWGGGRDSDDDTYKRGGQSYSRGSADKDNFRGGGRSYSRSSADKDNFRGGGRSNSRSSADKDNFRGGGRSNSRSSGHDWVISGGRSSRSSSHDRSFGGSCFICGRPGHRASECPKKTNF